VPVGVTGAVVTVQPLQLGKRVYFRPTVSCCSVPNLGDSCGAAEKAALWWQANDFAEFLRVRVAMGRAYRAVAKRRGVKIDISSPPEPDWAHESRRGLALGRKRAREKNRQLYINAVLEEQSRQRKEMLLSVQEAPVSNLRPMSFVMDLEKLAEVARQISERDRCYAFEQAKKEYERTLRGEANEKKGFPALISGSVVAGTWTELGKGASAPSSQPESPQKQVPYSPTGDAYPLLRGKSFLLFPDIDSDERVVAGSQEDESSSMQRSVSPESRSSSKGFGLSRDDLEQAGLTVTGHLLRRGRTNGVDAAAGAGGSWDGGDSDASAKSDACGDSDCSEPFSP